MDRERRRFRRVNADDECMVFPVGNRAEYPVRLRDISEEGLCFEIQADAKFEVGSELEFQFLSDAIGIDNVDDDDVVVQGEAAVVRIEKDASGKLLVGCKMLRTSESYSEYVKQVKIRGFIRMIRNANSEIE